MKTNLLLFLVTVPIASAQTPAITAVVNGFSVAPGVSPGSLALVIGNNFGADKTALSVTVGGKPAFLLAALNTQLNIQIPVELQPGATTLVVSRSGSPATSFSLTLTQYSPGVQSPDGKNALLLSPSGDQQVSQVKANDVVTVYATGLGPTNPPATTGVPANGSATCVVTPQVTLGGVPLQVLFCGLGPGTIGVWQLNLKIPSGIPGGAQPLVVTIGSSPPLNVIVVATGVTISSVVNAGSAQNAPVAPGSIVAITGTGFGNKDVVTGFSATAAAGISVTMNGLPAQVLNVLASGSPPQLNVIAPIELPTQGMISIVVTTSDGSSATLQVNMAPASPGIFRIGYKNYGLVRLVNPNWPAPDPAQALGVTLDCAGGGILAAGNCGRPFQPGDLVQIYATGLGLATPGGDPNAAPLPDGQLAPSDGSVTYQTIVQPSVMVGGVPAQVSWSGLVPGLAGEYQVNITIPAGVTPGDDVPLVLTAGGLSDSVSVAIGGGQ